VKGVLTHMDKHTIIKLHQKGESNRSIARMTGINRKTVGKYVNEYKINISMLGKKGVDAKDTQERILEAPKYDSSNRKNKKYNKEIDKLLDEILENEMTKDKLLGSHKISLTGKEIHHQIINAGHDIGKTTIYKKIREKKDKAKECFIRQDYDLGDRLEFDFGEVSLMIAGEKRKYYMAVLASPGGNFSWAYLYRSQKKEVFLNAHVEFFEMIGGAYKEVVYDNMKNVVSKFIGRNQKELNKDLLNLSLYYGFDINVTNAFSGNEKGYVESKVKKLRRDIFSTKYSFSSFENARKHMKNELFKINENSDIEAEKEYLLPHKPKLDLAKISTVTVNKYSFARIENNAYSLPDYLVGRKVVAKVYHESIKFYSNQHFVCEHKKIDGSNEVSIDIRHYIKTFEKKPGAIRNSLALKSMPRLKTIYDIYFKSNPRKFVALLKKYQDLSFDTMIKIINDQAKIVSKDKPSSSIHSMTRNQLHLYNNLMTREEIH
jgi:transposase